MKILMWFIPHKPDWYSYERKGYGTWDHCDWWYDQGWITEYGMECRRCGRKKNITQKLESIRFGESWR